MAETPKDDAAQLLDEIKAIKVQAEVQLQEITKIQTKAGSEGLLAFNAKKACEEHATTVANLKGTAEADANTIATNKQRSDESVVTITSDKVTAEASAKAIEARRKEIEHAATSTTTTLGNLSQLVEAANGEIAAITALRKGAEDLNKAIADFATATKQSETDANESKKKASQSALDAVALVTNITNDHEISDETLASMKALLEQATTAETNLKQVLDHLKESDNIATGHEKRVEVLTKQLEDLIGKVEGLLPGATSAGLASSFNKQRARFGKPQEQWLAIFIGCIVGLVLLALPSFFAAIGLGIHPQDETWNGAWRNMLLRLPVVLPIIWLGIYAGRNYMMSLRMEEDYAYKEAISTSFEGYKREMQTIGTTDVENPTPLTILCTNILKAIAERPGRIYEGKQKDINLLTEIQDGFEKGKELSKKKLATH